MSKWVLIVQFDHNDEFGHDPNTYDWADLLPYADEADTFDLDTVQVTQIG